MTMVTTVRLFSDFEPSAGQVKFLENCFERVFTDETIRVTWNVSGDCELAIVINYSLKFAAARTPKGGLIKVIQEPIHSKGLSRRSSRHHSSIFSSVFTHTPSGDKREIETVPGLLPSEGIEFPSDTAEWPVKTKRLSTVTSRLRHLVGHVARDEFVTSVCGDSRFDMDCFGRGREEIDNKSVGLLGYQYSLAFENSRSASYVTEKLTDCFFTNTVPIYHGAPKVARYFPVDSFIEFPNLSIQEFESVLNQLGNKDFEGRQSALAEARRIAIEELSLAAIACRVLQTLDLSSPRRWTRVWTSDTITRVIQSAFWRLVARLRRGLGSAHRDPQTPIKSATSSSKLGHSGKS